MAEKFRRLEDFDGFINNLNRPNRSSAPFYSNMADYNTNSKSYYDDLSRKAHLFEILAQRIWEYDEELAKRFEEWDKLIENFPQAVKDLLEQWLLDGTLGDIINEVIFKDLNDLITALSLDVAKNTQDIADLIKLDYKTRKAIYQRYAMNMELGNEENPLFEGSNRANQGIAYVNHNDKEYLFTRSRVEGSAWEDGELSRIVLFEFNDNQLSSSPIAVSKPMRIGHQGISAYVNTEEDNIYLITSVHNNKGYAKIKWNGEATCQDDVKDYVLLNPNNTPNDKLSIFYNCTASCDVNGEFVVLSGSTTLDSPLRYVLVYRSEDIECTPNYVDAKPLNVFKITPPAYSNGNVVQDIAVDDSFIYILSGFNEYEDPFNITTYGFGGELIGYTKMDLSKNKYSKEDLIGKEVTLEPEGLTIRGKNLLAECVNNERIPDCTSNCMKNFKYVYELMKYKKDSLSEPINSGLQQYEPPSNIHMHGNGHDISLNKGDAFQLSYYDFPTMSFTDVFNITREHLFSFYDNRAGSNNDQHITMGGYYKPDEQYAIIRGDRNNASGAGIDLGTILNPTGAYVKTQAPNSAGKSFGTMLAGESGNFRPLEDGIQDLGSAGYKWSMVHANEISTTSDKNLKRNIEDSDAGLEFINALHPVKYQLLNNDKNRYGIVAQELEKTSQDLGIDFGGLHKETIENGEERYSMSYNDLIAPLIKSVQELSKEVEELKKELGK